MNDDNRVEDVPADISESIEPLGRVLSRPWRVESVLAGLPEQRSWFIDVKLLISFTCSLWCWRRWPLDTTISGWWQVEDVQLENCIRQLTAFNKTTSTTTKLLITMHEVMFSVASVSMYVCNMITFESLDTESSLLVGWYIFRDYGSSLLWKSSGQGWGQSCKMLKIPYSCNVHLNWRQLQVYIRQSNEVHMQNGGFWLRAYWMVWPPSLSIDWKYKHSRVVCIRLEANVVLILIV